VPSLGDADPSGSRCSAAVGPSGTDPAACCGTAVELRGAPGRFLGGVVPLRLVRLANCGSAEWPRGAPSEAAPVYPNAPAGSSEDGAGSERRREGLCYLAKEGNEEVPAPTACVGDACGATSCARQVFNHIMLWSASGVTTSSTGRPQIPGRSLGRSRAPPSIQSVPARAADAWPGRPRHPLLGRGAGPDELGIASGATQLGLVQSVGQERWAVAGAWDQAPNLAWLLLTCPPWPP
jgi:hypothetical protein